MNEMLIKADKKYGDKKIYQFIRELIFRSNKDNILAAGAQLAYHFIMSFFPFIIFLLTMLTFTSLTEQDVILSLSKYLPDNITQILKPIIQDIISSRSTTVLSVSLITTLWAASNGINNLIKTMRRVFNIESNRNFFIKRIIAFVYTIVIVFIIIMTLLTNVFSALIIEFVTNYLGYSMAFEALWNNNRIILPLCIMVLGFSLMYKMGPGFPKNKGITFRESLIGGTFSAVSWSILSYFFNLFISSFGHYSKTYGSLAGIFIFLLWLYMVSIIILFGAEIIAAYTSVYKGRFTSRSNGQAIMNKSLL